MNNKKYKHIIQYISTSQPTLQFPIKPLPHIHHKFKSQHSIWLQAMKLIV
jgi:hypothetical protein